MSICDRLETRRSVVMNINELITKVADECKLTKVDAEKVIRSVFNQITESLKEVDEVKIPGFGTFSKRVRKERTGINPSNGQTIQIPETKQVSFKSAKHLKESL